MGERGTAAPGWGRKCIKILLEKEKSRYRCACIDTHVHVVYIYCWGKLEKCTVMISSQA